ncbi:MAG: GAF domain-containing protein [Gemmatimonas sp.]
MSNEVVHDDVAHPPFGEADLSNCERELIHLAGAIQPHGALLVLRESDLAIVQLSTNTANIVGVEHEALLGASVSHLGGDVEAMVQRYAKEHLLLQPVLIRCTLGADLRRFEGTLHRDTRAGLILELQPVAVTPHHNSTRLPQLLTEAVERISAAGSLTGLSDQVVSCVRQLTGYDRVMLYQFDADGHGEVIAESRNAHLQSFFGHHYPASDIPQRARELYLRNRVRVLVDVDYVPVPVVPPVSPESGEELDMSLCSLRSMSPLHLQYLRNMGVTATLVTSLVMQGRLWGLVVCHHDTPRPVSSEIRTACELLSEVVSTRISVLENRAQIEAELFVRELENRLMHAATETGDWRDALFDNPEENLLTPVDAHGVALFYQGEILTAGEIPDRSELRRVAAWLETRSPASVFHSSAFRSLDTELSGMPKAATGVMAIELSRGDGEFLVWFRREQTRTTNWAGDPNKPVQAGINALELSPRRSFEAWSEIIRDTARAWTQTDIAIATAMRGSLVDMILQMRALRALIAQRQASVTLASIESAGEPMILANGDGQVLVVNKAFHALAERPLLQVRDLADLAPLFVDQAQTLAIIRRISTDMLPWRGEMRIVNGPGGDIPVALRADPVPGLRGEAVGYIFIFTDLRQRRDTRAMRARIARTIAESQSSKPLGDMAAMMTQDFDHLLSAILSNASAAVMQISDSSTDASTGTLLRDLEGATRRAAELTSQIIGASTRNDPHS